MNEKVNGNLYDFIIIKEHTEKNSISSTLSGLWYNQ